MIWHTDTYFFLKCLSSCDCFLKGLWGVEMLVYHSHSVKPPSYHSVWFGVCALVQSSLVGLFMNNSSWYQAVLGHDCVFTFKPSVWVKQNRRAANQKQTQNEESTSLWPKEASAGQTLSPVTSQLFCPLHTSTQVHLDSSVKNRWIEADISHICSAISLESVRDTVCPVNAASDRAENHKISFHIVLIL